MVWYSPCSAGWASGDLACFPCQLQYRSFGAQYSREKKKRRVSASECSLGGSEVILWISSGHQEKRPWWASTHYLERLAASREAPMFTHTHTQTPCRWPSGLRFAHDGKCLLVFKTQLRPNCPWRHEVPCKWLDPVYSVARGIQHSLAFVDDATCTHIQPYRVKKVIKDPDEQSNWLERSKRNILSGTESCMQVHWQICSTCDCMSLRKSHLNIVSMRSHNLFKIITKDVIHFLKVV